LDSQLTLPTEYDEFVRTLVTLGSRYSANDNGRGNGNGMEWEQIRASAIKTAPVISKEQRQQWRDKGYCVRCGSKRHWVKDCDLQPSNHRVLDSETSSESSGTGTIRAGAVRVSAVQLKTTAKSVHLGKGNGKGNDNDTSSRGTSSGHSYLD
jgi:hypothetical protein